MNFEMLGLLVSSIEADGDSDESEILLTGPMSELVMVAALADNVGLEGRTFG